ncbi:hypothetical protein AM587_10004037 [Phytophthora nicotianae]|uniref:Uncharacterized protein n=1 Tax=Phytophthora nicotianae TaxID=4792 RepID=A0A0W8CFY3_PHYNI|nr:hypothetical protein AM587_10004037 [Phytophthora nicotianae]
MFMSAHSFVAGTGTVWISAVETILKSAREQMLTTEHANAYDEKDDLESLKARLQRRKKPIYAGLVFLAVVVIGVTVGTAANGGSKVNTESAQKDSATPSPSVDDSAQTGQQTQVDSDAGAVKAAKDSVSSPSSGWSSSSTSGSGSVAGEASAGQGWSLNSTEGSSTSTPTPTPTSTQAPSQSSSGEALAYSIVDFDWSDASNWEYASGATVSSNMVTSNGITLTPDNSAEPIRTKEGWSGEKVVYIEWERTSTSDTNIWMLNTKLQSQFGKGNGWPYWGELDLFEMFTQDAADIPAGPEIMEHLNELIISPHRCGDSCHAVFHGSSQTCNGCSRFLAAVRG